MNQLPSNTLLYFLTGKDFKKKETIFPSSDYVRQISNKKELVKKKIVHITQATGGVKTYTSYILEYADKELFNFVIIAPADAIFEKFCSEKNITYYPIDLDRNINPFNNISVLIKIISILKKEKPDLIHTHSAKGGFLGRLAAKFVKAEVIYTPHAFSYLSFFGIKRTVFYLLEFISRKWSNTLLAISHSEANRAIYELGYDKNHVRVILNSIPNLPEKHDRNYNSCKKIRMIGRLTVQKNHILFLQIAKELLKDNPELEFSILGAGIHDHLSLEINSFLKDNKLENKIKIESWGSIERSKTFLDETDVFVMTSVFEGLPFSLIEAMSHGIPCVVSKVDGNTDVIQNNENGFSCLSIDEFCSKIRILINNENTRKTIGQAGYNYVKKYHCVAQSTKKLQDLYLDILTLN